MMCSVMRSVTLVLWGRPAMRSNFLDQRPDLRAMHIRCLKTVGYSSRRVNISGMSVCWPSANIN
jgi:hypothetical protein